MEKRYSYPMEDSVFTRIIRRELPAEILWEDDRIIVILNKFPNIEGETLVITKEQVPYMFDLDPALYLHLMEVTKKVAKVLDKTYSTLRTCMVVEGFDVPHVHVRLYPVTKKGLNISHGPEATSDELKIVGDKIRLNLT